MENKTIYQVDTFTNEIFKGNPAAVMLLDEIPTSRFMQNIAMEMNLSETAFIVSSGDNTFRIKFFTPTTEIQLAGHPTLASAHILYKYGIVPSGEKITFISNDATLEIEKNGEHISMSFPKYPLTKIKSNPVLNNIIGFEPIELFSSNYNWIIAVANNVEDIKNCNPNFSQLLENDLGHLMVTAKSETDDEDFVVRCFAPIMGVNEDPVTGSAHCALTPLWANKQNKTKLKSLQLSKRTGRLNLELLDDRVLISGNAITVFEINIIADL